jgi:molybdate transport system substrate-binding protein
MHPRGILVRAATLALAWLALLPLADARPADPPELLVFAAASLTDVLDELNAGWRQRQGVPARTSFAASSALARQIEAGSDADVFISADQQWMDYLAARHLIDATSRRNLAGNRLVLIAPADSGVALRIEPGFKLLEALQGGRLATGDPDTVPAGRYARAALTTLGVWDRVASRLVRAENVRAAMTYVARGEAPLGIVYATDAQIEEKIRVVGTFPDSSHEAITYPAAATASAGRHAAAYLAYLAGKDAAAIWKKHGFRELSQ